MKLVLEQKVIFGKCLPYFFVFHLPRQILCVYFGLSPNTETRAQNYVLPKFQGHGMVLHEYRINISSTIDETESVGSQPSSLERASCYVLIIVGHPSLNPGKGWQINIHQIQSNVTYSLIIWENQPQINMGTDQELSIY